MTEPKMYVSDKYPPETWGMIENEEFLEWAKKFYARLIKLARDSVFLFYDNVTDLKPRTPDNVEALIKMVFEGFNSPIAFIYKTWKFDKKREMEKAKEEE